MNQNHPVVRVGVLGARGKMGSTVVDAVNNAPGMEVVAALDLGDSLEALVANKAEVVVDFTTPDAVMANLEFVISHGMHAVVGTTGFDDSRIETLKRLLAKSPKAGLLIAPNFGLGAILMMEFSKRAAALFESVEIIEMHHPNKVDAPSGTARRTAEIIARARRSAARAPMPDATTESLDGARGARVDGVPIHSIRARGFVAHQEVIFGGLGETLTIRHDSLDRQSFMPGVLLGITKVITTPGLTFGLENFLDI
jgi:4-hydroxy-tetrahydrodipicolinate reductase